jgi:outer membrane lipopolysaccharide assembly protein LptE/RlpB
MKNIIIILILILSSCGLKHKNSDDFKEPLMESIVDIYEPISEDYEIFYDEVVLSSSNVSSSIDIKVNQSNDLKRVINNNSTANVTITDDTDPLDTTKGIIAYSVPTKMIVGKKYKIKVRITKSRNEKTVLIIGDRNIPINDVDVDSKIRIEDIRVDRIMSAELISDGSSLLITQLSSTLQNIDRNGYTEWSWLVTTLNSGDVYLKLVIKIIIEENVKRDIVVFDKKIYIEPDRIWSFKTWFSKYWQWLLSTIIIPILVWLYKRR